MCKIVGNKNDYFRVFIKKIPKKNILISVLLICTVKTT